MTDFYFRVRVVKRLGYVSSTPKPVLPEEECELHSSCEDKSNTTDVLTNDALNSLRRLFFAKLFYPHVDSTEELVCSRLLANP